MIKKAFTSLLLLWISLGFVSEAKSQNLLFPQKQFKIFTKDSVTMERDSQKKLDVLIVRSKRFKKKVRMDVTSSLPAGVEISFDPPSGSFDACIATIDVGAAAKPGTYLVVISGTIQSKSIGRLIKLTVAEKI